MIKYLEYDSQIVDPGPSLRVPLPFTMPFVFIQAGGAQADRKIWQAGPLTPWPISIVESEQSYYVKLKSNSKSNSKSN